jgi:hypothetical protein
VLPFDRIELSTGDGTTVQLSVKEFCDLPLAERLRAVLERRVTFFHGQQLVESREALKALRERAA